MKISDNFMSMLRVFTFALFIFNLMYVILSTHYRYITIPYTIMFLIAFLDIHAYLTISKPGTIVYKIFMYYVRRK